MVSGRGAASGGVRWVAVGVGAGVVLALARTVLLYGMERVAHGGGEELFGVRVAAGSPRVVGESVGAGLVAAGLAAFAAGRSGAARAASWAAAAALGGLAMGAVLLGWLGDASRRVGTGTETGLVVTLVVLAGAVAGAALLPVAAARVRRGRAVLAMGVLVAVAAPLAVRALAGGPGDTMPVRETLRDLAGGDLVPEVVAERADAPARFGVLCPGSDYRMDGSDMPAFVMPPPAEVVVAIPADAGEARLRLRAGVDRSVFEQDVPPGAAVRFVVEVGGRRVLDERLALEQTHAWPGTEWLDVPGGAVAVRGGSEVRLRTELAGWPAAAASGAPAVPAGFGGLRLVRERRVPRTRSSPERPNVVFVVMDTLRADRLSTYGHGRPTSPNLDALAARGTRFDEAYATASWTWPSTASLLTGLLPEEHGVTSEVSCYLADALPTLAEALQAAGLSTAAWSANALIVPGKNFDQGFELFDHGTTTRQSTVVMPGVLEWLDAIAGTRFFLYLHLADPHSPLEPLPEARARFAADVPRDFSPHACVEYGLELLAGCGHGPDGTPRTDACVPPEHQRWISDLYDACVWSGDRWLGAVLERLERHGLTDETLVVFTSDHGEELFDHGLASHGQALFRELVRVPLVLAGPGVPVGAARDEVVSNRHLPATLARLAGARWEGREAVDLLRGGDDATVLFSTENGWWNGHFRQPLLGVRRGDHVLHLAPEGNAWGARTPSPEPQRRLYDVAADPDERVDLSRANPRLADELQAWLERHTAELRARRVDTAVPAGEATLEYLRQIGYIGEE